MITVKVYTIKIMPFQLGNVVRFQTAIVRTVAAGPPGRLCITAVAKHNVLKKDLFIYFTRQEEYVLQIRKKKERETTIYRKRKKDESASKKTIAKNGSAPYSVSRKCVRDLLT